jgi:hypothetical protein
MTNTLPTITTKQQEILKLIYRYRFLNRTQIQALLGHKDKRRIISWLKDLRDKQYVDWHYNATDFIAKSKPAIYYLSLNGIRYLREVGCYPGEELRKRYKEPGRTQVFIDRCLLVADCCIALQAKSGDELKYSFVLSADYANPESSHHFLNELKPHLFFAKQQGDEATKYLLEDFEQTLPRYQLRKRLKDYVDYLASEWDESNGPVPIALFVCANTADLLYIKRRVKKLVEENWSDEYLQLRVTTLEKITKHSVASTIWEEIQ